MNPFDILFHPDHDEQSEREEIACAANLLQVNEFQLLQLAYKDWFNKEIPSRECDRLFEDYMMHKDVPHWVHHYARRIIGLDAAGSLNDRDADYHRYDSQFRLILRLWTPSQKFHPDDIIVSLLCHASRSMFPNSEICSRLIAAS